MSWLKSVTVDTVVVHTRDGRSIRGVLVGAYRTEVALAHASLLHFGGEDRLDGDVIVLRDNVSSPGAGVAHHLAEHSYRAAVIGYLLASLEGADPEKTATICLFHDTAEARIGDLHWTAKRYIRVKEREQVALTEQLERLPDDIARKIAALAEAYEERSSLEGRLAHEADLLECLLQAREYQTRGYSEAQDWIDGCLESLQTETARTLARACIETEPGSWFAGLKRKPKP